MFCIFVVLIICPLLKKLDKIDGNDVKIITPRFVTLYTIFAISWYIYTTSGSWFTSMVNLSDHMINSILTGYILPENSYASHILFGQWSISLQFIKILSIISIFFIIIGILSKDIGVFRSDILYTL